MAKQRTVHEYSIVDPSKDGELIAGPFAGYRSLKQALDARKKSKGLTMLLRLTDLTNYEEQAWMKEKKCFSCGGNTIEVEWSNKNGNVIGSPSTMLAAYGESAMILRCIGANPTPPGPCKASNETPRITQRGLSGCGIQYVWTRKNEKPEPRHEMLRAVFNGDVLIRWVRFTTRDHKEAVDDANGVMPF